MCTIFLKNGEIIHVTKKEAEEVSLYILDKKVFHVRMHDEDGFKFLIRLDEVICIK